jgi:hypothetical protein
MNKERTKVLGASNNGSPIRRSANFPISVKLKLRTNLSYGKAKRINYLQQNTASANQQNKKRRGENSKSISFLP